MTIDELQGDIRRAFVSGGPGVVVSGLVWLAAGLVERASGTGPAFAVLFVGGMLIFPASLLLARGIWRRAPAAAGNPLGGTALESTIAMIGGLFAAWLFLPIRPALVLPLAAVAVGTHYAVFRTIYGDRTFWMLGGLVTVAGAGAAITGPWPAGLLPVGVGLAEFAFGLWLSVRSRRTG